MEFTISLRHTQTYLPTKRHRKERKRIVEDPVTVSVPVLDAEEIPVAFIVRTLKSVYEGAKSYGDFDDSCPNDYKIHAEELRTYAGELYQPVRVTYGNAISTVFEPLDYIGETLERGINCSLFCLPEKEGYTEKSVLLHDDLQERRERLQEMASAYVFFDGKVYQKIGEPMYEIVTFGLGHNHGGTALFVTQHYNENIGKENYFTALQREEALEYCRKIALGRGDTEYVDNIGDYCDIQVLMPELVKRNPARDHGDGNPLLNELNQITQNAKSASEAAICVVLTTLANQESAT